MPHGVEASVGASLGVLATAQRLTGAHGLSWRAECGYNLRRFAFDQKLALDWADIKTALFRFCVLVSGASFGGLQAARDFVAGPWVRQAQARPCGMRWRSVALQAGPVRPTVWLVLAPSSMW